MSASIPPNSKPNAFTPPTIDFVKNVVHFKGRAYEVNLTDDTGTHKLTDKDLKRVLEILTNANLIEANTDLTAMTITPDGIKVKKDGKDEDVKNSKNDRITKLFTKLEAKFKKNSQTKFDPATFDPKISFPVLRNLGENTCYADSILEMLVGVRGFIESKLAEPTVEHPKNVANGVEKPEILAERLKLIRALRAFFKAIDDKNHAEISKQQEQIIEFHRTLKCAEGPNPNAFKKGAQHDAAEFLQNILVSLNISHNTEIRTMGVDSAGNDQIQSANSSVTMLSVVPQTKKDLNMDLASVLRRSTWGELTQATINNLSCKDNVQTLSYISLSQNEEPPEVIFVNIHREAGSNTKNKEEILMESGKKYDLTALFKPQSRGNHNFEYEVVGTASHHGTTLASGIIPQK